MRPSVLASVVFLFFTFPSFSYQSSSQSTSQPAPASTRDPQAINLLTQCLATTGGAPALAAVQDFTAIGTITYFWAGDPVSGNVTIRGVGFSLFRLDAVLPDGTHSWAVTDAKGTIKGPDGSTKTIQYANSTSRGALTFPQLRLAAALADPSYSVSVAGTASVNGRTATIVQVLHVFSADQDPTGDLTKLSSKSFLIDSQTSVVLATRDTLYSEDGRMLPTTHEVDFSNFTTVNGLQIPFSISEKIGGQQTWSLQLTSITLNGGLTSNLFQF